MRTRTEIRASKARSKARAIKYAAAVNAILYNMALAFPMQLAWAQSVCDTSVIAQTG